MLGAGRPCGEYGGHPRMDRLPARAEQGVVRGVADQRVPEGVAHVRESPPMQQPGVDEAIELALERHRLHRSDRAEHVERELAPDDRAELGHLLRRPQPIQTRGERLLECRRDHQIEP